MLGSDGALKDTRFILVRAEHPYIQFAAAARVINTEKWFIVGGTNGRERDESQVSNGMIEKVAESLVAALLCVKRCVFNLSVKS